VNTIEYIKSDIRRLCGDNTIKSIFKWYFFPQGSTFPHDVWFRILQSCKKRKILKYSLGIYAYFRERHFALKYGIHINSNVSVGEGLFIVHGGGIYINVSSIGCNFTCYQSVTLGRLRDGIPTVENNVTVYPGAVVVGDIVLHNGCSIGANSYCDKNVDEYTKVYGIPAKNNNT